MSFAQVASFSFMDLSECDCGFQHLSLVFEFMSSVSMALSIFVVLSPSPAILSNFNCVLALLLLARELVAFAPFSEFDFVLSLL